MAQSVRALSHYPIAADARLNTTPPNAWFAAVTRKQSSKPGSATPEPIHKSLHRQADRSYLL